MHDQTSKSGTDRRDGFTEWMQANAPGIQLLEPQYGGGDQAKSADITKSILSANPDLKGIYGSNEGSAIGVVKGVQESGRQGVTIVGFDSGKAQIDAIRSGVMLGAITQNPVGMGEQLVGRGGQGDQGREPAEGHRHRLLLVRQEQRRQRRRSRRCSTSSPAVERRAVR